MLRLKKALLLSYDSLESLAQGLANALCDLILLLCFCKYSESKLKFFRNLLIGFSSLLTGTTLVISLEDSASFLMPIVSCTFLLSFALKNKNGLQILLSKNKFVA